MLKFKGKNGKKLMEMNDQGEIIFYDKAFEEKMGDLKEKTKGDNEDDKEITND